MQVELRFREAASGDAIGYLVKSGSPDDGGMVVKSEDDFSAMVRGVMGGSNRSREILITDSMESARAIALVRRSDTFGEMVITQVDDQIYAVGILNQYGVYDDGIPLIVDVRENGRPLELDGTWTQSPNGINVEVSNGELELLEIPEANEDTLSM